MSLSYPLLDLMSFLPISQMSFMLSSRQELSRQASGITIGKDLGPAIWMPSFTIDVAGNDDAVAYEARLNSLDGVIHPFTAYDLRRPYPRLYASGSFNDTGVLHSVNANNKALSLSGLDAGFALSVGDYLCFDYGGARALHQVVEAVTADGSGLTAEFEVRPFIRAGFSLTSPVTLKKPTGQFTLMSGSISSKAAIATSAISFQAVQYFG